MSSPALHYKRSRFATRLLEHRLYTAGHHWLERQDDGRWRVGFTKFAARMLGEIVELAFEVDPGASVEKGQIIGWLEGFKAVSDLYAPLSGRFEGVNPSVDASVELVTTDPYGEGWLFVAAGEPDEDCFDVHEYVALLDTTIDKMLGQRHE